VGGETPETGTPLTRSLSPSSDGNGSIATHSERGASRRQKKVAGGSRAIATRPSDEVVPTSPDVERQVEGASAASDCNGSAPAESAETEESHLSDAETEDRAGKEDASSTASTAAAGGGKRSHRRKGSGYGETAQNRDMASPVFMPYFQNMPHMAMGGMMMQVPMPVPMGAYLMPGPQMNSVLDRRVIEVLAAPAKTHARLLRTAQKVPELLMDPKNEKLCNSAELYGSMALDMNEPAARKGWKQDWASYYVNGQSDVDIVVDMRKDASPNSVAEILLKHGAWRLVGQVQVHKFASTQFTLLGSFAEDSEDAGKEEETNMVLDLTCIENTTQFKRFKKRQEAFRSVFVHTKARIEATYGPQGVLAFDAYIHLLKAFAAKVHGNALTGYQATCIGLFTLQICHFRLKPTLSIALAFFEGFLSFCSQFYGDQPDMQSMHMGMAFAQSVSYRHMAIDLSNGRLKPRRSSSWRSELYFNHTEANELKTRPEDWMNVTHSLDPARVSSEASLLLMRTFSENPDDLAAAFGAGSQSGS